VGLSGSVSASAIIRTGRSRLVLLALQFAPVLLFLVLFVAFGLLSDRFLSAVNFRNILTQATHTAVMAIGITFPLLVRGVDLSIGSSMYLAVVVLGLYLRDVPFALALPAMLLTGLAFGAVNAFFITRLRVAAFITTLATLFIGRGFALHLSETKMVYQSDFVLTLGRASALGVPWAIWILVVVAVLAWIVLTQTPYGRQIYAVGADPEAAAKAGIRVRPIVFSVYCICGVCAAIGGLISVSQTGAAAATFGYQEEFPVIAAAVLGGTSLFGGRGGVFGSIFGAVLVQTTANGLVMLNADPYLYPLVNSLIIFVATWVDGRRTAILERLERRQIRVEAA
jgi:ribose transport system permease protein